MDTFKIIKQPKVDAEFQIMRVYSSTKKLIDKMSEMTGMKKAHLIHQMVLFCMDRLEVVDVEED